MGTTLHQKKQDGILFCFYSPPHPSSSGEGGRTLLPRWQGQIVTYSLPVIGMTAAFPLTSELASLLGSTREKIFVRNAVLGL